MDFVEDAVELLTEYSNKESDLSVKSKSFLFKGHLEYKRGNFPKAKDAFIQAREISKKYNYLEAKIESDTMLEEINDKNQ